jgi:ABC-2 type transport system permease protein
MIPQLRAEFRKLITVRSTYIVSILALLLSGFVAFWVFGYKGDISSESLVSNAIQSTAMASSVFIAVIGILLVAHEYRYNTIMYTLTASNSRTKVLLAKLAVMTGYAVAFMLFAAAFAAALSMLGAHMGHLHVVSQHVEFLDVMWRMLFYVLGYMWAGMLITVVVRHVVGAVVTILVVPTTVESLLRLFLKENAKYLPFTSLEQVSATTGTAAGKAALIFGLYLLAGGALAWWIFEHRDAN